MTHRYRHTAATLLAVGCTCLVAACGSSSSTSTGSGAAAAGPGGARQGVGLKLTATQQACLKKHGVKSFTGGAGPGGTAGAKPGSAPTGARPSAAARRRFKRGTAPSGFGGAAQRRQQAALKACGVSLPTAAGAPGAGAGPPAG